MEYQEQDARRLVGGNFDAEVVHVGNTVRRTAGPWTPAVHAVLAYLASVGFAGSPIPMGMDHSGREILSFIPGDVGHYPLAAYMRSDATLIEAARLLRAFHDASALFRLPDGAIWRQAAADPGPVEVVCHNDWAPYNAIFRDQHLVGMIDWDFCRPGSRLWDLAWMAHTWVPLRDDTDAAAQGWVAPPSRSTRLRLLCDAYGLTDRSQVLPRIRARMLGTAEWLEQGAANGETVFLRLVQEGHAAGYRRAVRFLDQSWESLEAALQVDESS
jgi:Phosphotransferase enzyme family